MGGGSLKFQNVIRYINSRGHLGVRSDGFKVLVFLKHIGSPYDSRNFEKPQNAGIIEFTKGVCCSTVVRLSLGWPNMRDQQK